MQVWYSLLSFWLQSVRQSPWVLLKTKQLPYSCFISQYFTWHGLCKWDTFLSETYALYSRLFSLILLRLMVAHHSQTLDTLLSVPTSASILWSKHSSEFSTNYTGMLLINSSKFLLAHQFSSSFRYIYWFFIFGWPAVQHYVDLIVHIMLGHKVGTIVLGTNVRFHLSNLLVNSA